MHFFPEKDSVSNNDFFATLPGLKVFDQAADDEFYRALPDDWSIVITDIRGSTKAIESGHYKEVNIVGAASITSVEKAVGKVAFVFGGDGATLLLSPAQLEGAKQALLELRSLSARNYGLELRVGIITAQEVKQAGKVIEVARYDSIPGRPLALIRGGGLAWAEGQIKGDEKYQLKVETSPLPELEGLSCRWQPLPSARGKILTLLVKPRKSEKIIGEVVKALEKILDKGISGSNPALTPHKSYKTVKEIWRDEILFHSKKLTLAFLARVSIIVLAVLTFKGKIPAIFDKESYLEAAPGHSDFHKYDEVLRLILDCTSQEETSILWYLEDLKIKEEIYYGVHRSDTALMTCFVENLNVGGHLHFIDGSNGGYAMAAKMMKAQMKDS